MINIDELIVKAIKNNETDRLKTLRLIKTEFMKKSTESNRTTKKLSDAEELKILSKMAAVRNETIEVYRKMGREDLAQIEESELIIINSFIPKQPSEDEVITKVKEVIGEYISQQTDDYKLSMKDMSPILKKMADIFPSVTNLGKITSSEIKKLL